MAASKAQIIPSSRAFIPVPGRIDFTAAEPPAQRLTISLMSRSFVSCAAPVRPQRSRHVRYPPIATELMQRGETSFCARTGYAARGIPLGPSVKHHTYGLRAQHSTLRLGGERPE